ncbi:TetR/AcrR family transcriptional regulator [Streptomyces albofaciens JCM 4342]|uniref:TetR/AcrR family transcriptional regulator n=1 Tax=Streptomyces albofaciens TaxID=66866 RepID=UPI00123BE1C6|nr:TetR/AcrR family transcriptional regulator [Streptomyces albofaciens]KAA6214059.1 TetR/AcrR family transcriptional regulator [Streptomyces albofaciens JCM 4342]
MKRAEQASETRAALIEAAKRLFAARGYLNTKVTDITAEAGRAAGSFYNHFAGKEELLKALLDELATESDRYAVTAEHKSDFTDPDAIRYHVAAYWRVHRDHAPTMLALRQAALVSEDFARTLEQFRRTQLEDLAGHLAYVKNLPASVETTLTLMSTMMDAPAQLLPELPEEEAVEVATRFIYRALNGTDYPPRA